MNEQEFHPGSVPVAVVARVYGKDASWVRAGIISAACPRQGDRNGNLVASIEEMDSRYGPGSISTSRQNDCTRKPDISGEENDDEK